MRRQTNLKLPPNAARQLCDLLHDSAISCVGCAAEALAERWSRVCRTQTPALSGVPSPAECRPSAQGCPGQQIAARSGSHMHKPRGPDPCKELPQSLRLRRSEECGIIQPSITDYVRHCPGSSV